MSLTGDFLKSNVAATKHIDKIREASCVERDRLFVIPGNHDIQRNREKDVWRKLREFFLQNLDGCSKWMAGEKAPDGVKHRWRDAIFERSLEFWNWIEQDLKRAILLPKNNSHGRLGYSVSVQGLPFPMKVIGLDSAWLCGDDNDVQKLHLTDHQIDRLMRDEKGKPFDGFRLVLVHHPLSDLGDERRSINLLSATSDLVLHGHQHNPLSEIRSDPDRLLQILAAGSLYEGDKGDRWINGFQLIDAKLDQQGLPLQYDVSFWAWSKNVTGILLEQYMSPPPMEY